MQHSRNFRTYEEEEKLSAFTRKYKYECKCGHKIVIYPFEKKASKVCRYCGGLVFINDKEEFKYKLSKEMKKLQDGK